MKFSLLLVGSIFLLSLVQKSKDFYLSGIENSDSGNCREAIEDYTRAIELDPNHDLAFFNRAIEKSHLDDHAGAVQDFSKSIEIKPTSSAYYARAKSQEILKNYEDALKDYSRAIELDPNDLSSYFDRGLLRIIVGDKINGRQDLRTARKLSAKEIYLRKNH